MKQFEKIAVALHKNKPELLSYGYDESSWVRYEAAENQWESDCWAVVSVLRLNAEQTIRFRQIVYSGKV